jgi:hypothetical protein
MEYTALTLLSARDNSHKDVKRWDMNTYICPFIHMPTSLTYVCWQLMCCPNWNGMGEHRRSCNLLSCSDSIKEREQKSEYKIMNCYWEMRRGSKLCWKVAAKASWRKGTCIPSWRKNGLGTKGLQRSVPDRTSRCVNTGSQDSLACGGNSSRPSCLGGKIMGGKKPGRSAGMQKSRAMCPG